ncbi:MAG: hypothetical protein IPK59_15230 [Rhodospirillaceae bacterium]|nr:hypothetical protein [Rhodospirillaceae bacterium]
MAFYESEDRNSIIALVSIGAGAVGFAAGALVAPPDSLGYAFLPGGAALLLMFWYLEFYRPGLHEEKLRQDILTLAGSSTESLVFNDGSKDRFQPKGAFWLRHRSIAIGFDPQHQLARCVFSLSKAIHMDWIYGFETLTQLEVLEGPLSGLGNRLRHVLGLQPKTAMMLRQTDVNGQSVDLPLHQPHVDKARELVRQVNFHRPKSALGAL